MSYGLFPGSVHFADSILAANGKTCILASRVSEKKKGGGGFISGVEQRGVEHAGKVRMGSVPNNCNVSPIARGCFTNVQRGCDNVAAYIQHPCKPAFAAITRICSEAGADALQ